MGKLFNWAIHWNTRCFMQRFQDEIDIVFTFKTFDQQDLLGSLQKQTKVAKSCRNTFTTPQTLLSVGFFFPAVLPSQTLLEVPLSPPLSNIINPSNVSLFFTKSKGAPTKQCHAIALAKINEYDFLYLLLSLWSAWRMFFAFILYKQFCLTYYNLLLTHTRK